MEVDEEGDGEENGQVSIEKITEILHSSYPPQMSATLSFKSSTMTMKEMRDAIKIG